MQNVIKIGGDPEHLNLFSVDFMWNDPKILANIYSGGVTCRWVASLTPARVNRWGGMISTPDAVLQAVIKRALIESGCPSHIVNDLMENAHERRWPTGLSTLETRQLNRRQYENYVTKRIPGEEYMLYVQHSVNWSTPTIYDSARRSHIFLHFIYFNCNSYIS